MKLLFASVLFAAIAVAGNVSAVRFPENPLLTLKSSPTVGDNINGPSVIKVPDWLPNKLGRYYMYFAHHRGMYIRLAYANSLHGPWKVYEPGVLNVSETAFYRPQPDPDAEIYGVYTHVASPEVYVDEANKRLIMWVHGQFSDGKMWPSDPTAAHAWLRQNGYSQNTQVTISTDGLHFKAQPAITEDPYLRVFEHNSEFYGSFAWGGWCTLQIRSRSLRQAPARFATRRITIRFATSRFSRMETRSTSFCPLSALHRRRLSTPPSLFKETGDSGRSAPSTTS